MHNPDVLTVYLNSSRRNAELNRQIEMILTEAGHRVLSPCTMTPQDSPLHVIFERNIALIRSADVMLVVLKQYGKDTAAEVGIAFGRGMPLLAIDFEGDPQD